MEKYSTETENKSNEEIFLGIDIAFVIDATGSMAPYISEAKKSVKDIIEITETSLKKILPDTYQDLLKFAIIAFRDHPPQEETFVTQIKDFNSSSYALDYLSGLIASGGGDGPEATIDGMHDAANKISWRKNTEKMLFLILDAPPHGIRYGTKYDCPCGYTEKDFMPFFAKNEIKVHVIRPPDNPPIQKMISIFEEYCPVEVKDFQPLESSILTSSFGCSDSSKQMITNFGINNKWLTLESTSININNNNMKSNNISSSLLNIKSENKSKEENNEMSSYITGKINDKIQNKISKLNNNFII